MSDICTPRPTTFAMNRMMSPTTALTASAHSDTMTHRFDASHFIKDLLTQVTLNSISVIIAVLNSDLIV